MKTTVAIMMAAALFGCAAKTKAPATTSTATSAPADPTALSIKLTSLYVNDQEKCLAFYTEKLGFAKRTDFSNGPFRWLTVAAPAESYGAELQLSPNDNPAAKAYQEAMFQQGQPAAMFYTGDVNATYERLKQAGVEFTMPVTDVTFANIAMLNDTCGNLIQITQLKNR